jgi:hypothetical protein
MPTRSGAQYIKHFDKTKDNTMPASTLNNSMTSESYLILTVLVAYAMVVWSSSSQLLHSHHTWVMLLLSIITQPVSMVVDALMLPHSLLLLLRIYCAVFEANLMASTAIHVDFVRAQYVRDLRAGRTFVRRIQVELWCNTQLPGTTNS